MATFAKFREMQKPILWKIFRENWVRKTAKMVTADFHSFRDRMGAKTGLFLGIKYTNLFDVTNSKVDWWQLTTKLPNWSFFPWNQLGIYPVIYFVKTLLSRNFYPNMEWENIIVVSKMCYVLFLLKQVISRKNCKICY